MKICTYNLRLGGHKNSGNHWQLLTNDLKADIVFAQETEDPQRYFPPEIFQTFRGSIYKCIPEGNWGSAILSKSHDLEGISIPEFDGWVVGARIKGITIGHSTQSILAFSVHAPSPGPYEVQVNRILDVIAGLRTSEPLIVAGDFNLTTAVRHKSELGLTNTAQESKILQRLRQEFGLLNAWQALHPNTNLPQTLRWVGAPTKPYHCDAIFLHHSLVPHLVSADVRQHEPYSSISDHNPICIELA